MTQRCKIQLVCKAFNLLPTLLIVGAINNVGYAFPSSGANCAQCHTDTGGGTVATSPNPLSLLAGQTGTVTFDVADLPGDAAALSLTGLDAAGLEATPDADWRARDNDTRFTLGITADGQQTFDVTIGPGAAPGDYPIGVFLAGTGSSPEGIWSTMSEFTINVSAAVIPEPATMTMFSIVLGIAAAFSIRRRRCK
jgi:hypothetical protein